MKKRLLSKLLTVAMAVGLLSVMLLTAGAVPADVDKTVQVGDSTKYEVFVPKGAELPSGLSGDSVNVTVAKATSDIAWSTGWYVVDSNAAISGTITISGTVNLILADDASLTVKSIYKGSTDSLTIWGQSAGTGTLTVEASAGDVITLTSLTVNGGKVNATSGSNYDGINAGTVIINGGTVTATSGTGYGICATSGVTIKGGTVTATGGSSAIYGALTATGATIEAGNDAKNATMVTSYTDQKYVKVSFHKHPLCTSTTCGHANGANEHKDTTFEPWNGTTAFEASKNYYLTKDVKLEEATKANATVSSGTVNLCLNGHTLDGNKQGSVIKIDGGTLNLCDCTGNGKITGGDTDYGGGVYMPRGTFNMYGGSIADNTATEGGGVSAYGNFNMYGGSIEKNEATDYGGGVYASGTFTMTGGSITNNTASNYGGGVQAGGPFKMTGGSITNNTVTAASGYGGGVAVYTKNATVGGSAKINGNTVSSTANNVYLATYGPGNSCTLSIDTPKPDMDIHVTTANYVGSDIVFNSVGDVVVASGADLEKYVTNFKCDSSSKIVVYNSTDNVLELADRPEDDSAPTYSAISEVDTKTANGNITFSRKNAPSGSKVTITVKPDEGYVLVEIVVLNSKGNEVKLTKVAENKYQFEMPKGGVTVDAEFVEGEPVPVEPEEPEETETDAPTAADFTDLDPTEWYIPGINYCLANGIMYGVRPGEFEPHTDATRGMVVAMIARVSGADLTTTDPWYESAILWGVQNGVTDGTAPEGKITREQLISMLYRYAQANGMDVSVGEDTNILDYDDARDVSDWAVSAMQWACGAGLVQGNNGNLNPTKNASRAEIAAIFQRFCELN